MYWPEGGRGAGAGGSLGRRGARLTTRASGGYARQRQRRRLSGPASRLYGCRGGAVTPSPLDHHPHRETCRRGQVFVLATTGPGRAAVGHAPSAGPSPALFWSWRGPRRNRVMGVLAGRRRAASCMYTCTLYVRTRRDGKGSPRRGDPRHLHARMGLASRLEQVYSNTRLTKSLHAPLSICYTLSRGLAATVFGPVSAFFCTDIHRCHYALSVDRLFSPRHSPWNAIKHTKGPSLL